MRNAMIIVTIVIAAFTACYLIAQGNRDKSGKSLTYTELADLIKNQAEPYILLDVRTAGEYQSGHIPSSINIPYDIIDKNLPTEDKSALIIVYCRSGHRSGIAQKTLVALGYTNVINFGGIGNWRGELEK